MRIEISTTYSTNFYSDFLTYASCNCWDKYITLILTFEASCVVNVAQGSVCIVNAASDRDVAVFAAGMIQASLIAIISVSFVLLLY